MVSNMLDLRHELVTSYYHRTVTQYFLLTYSPNSHGVQMHSLDKGVGNNREEEGVMACLA
jgi:hypothetical protein